MNIIVARIVKTLRILCILFGFALWSVNLGTAAVTQAPFETEQQVLDNGMTVLVTPMPDNAMVSLYALFKTGSATEGRFLGSGISHLMEHLMFKGTHSQEVGEIASSIQALGGTVNASTSMDFTIYTVTVPARFFSKALNVLADMVQHPNFDPDEFNKERDVVIQEMLMNEDKPQRELIRRLYEKAYLNHPYRLPVIGFRSVLEGLQREDVQEYYRTNYTPNNMVFSVAGNVQPRNVMPMIAEVFSEFTRRQDVPRNLPVERDQIMPRYFETPFATQVTLMAMAFPSVSLLDEDLFALDVLAKILGQGRSSRLYQTLYEKEKMVYSITSWNHTPVDSGLFVINAALDAGNLTKVQEQVRAQIESVRSKGVTSAELRKAKRQVISEFVSANQTTENLAWRQAVDYAFTGDAHFSLQYVEKIQEVNREDILRVAQAYLRPSAMTTVVIRPREDFSESVSAEVVEDNPSDSPVKIEKVVLKNGLTLLLRPDATFPWVNFQAVFQGGGRLETDTTNGLSQLFEKVWTRGTKTRSAVQIDDFLESKGMDIGTHAGRNSVGLSLACLSDDVVEGLSVFKDILLNPVFPEEQLEKARADQIKDIGRQQDNIFQYTARVLRDNLYQVNPMRFDMNGTIESLAGLKREDLQTYYHSVISPSNMVLAVYGDIDTQDMIRRLEKAFGDMVTFKTEIPVFSEPAITQPVRVVENLPKQQAMLMVAFHALDIYQEDHYKLEVLAAILGSSFSGRLFNVVREKFGEAYTLGGALQPGLDTGFTYFYVLTGPESIETVEALVRAEIERLKREPVSEEELQNMKNYLIGSFESGLQTNSALALTTALDELYGLGYDNKDTYKERVQAVRSEDISQMARRYLDLNKSVTVIMIPESSKNS